MYNKNTPNKLLKSHLIDEWQETSSIWEAVFFKVDNLPEKGWFILAGPSTPHRKVFLHSGADRIEKLRLRTMLFFERGALRGLVSLQYICSGKNIWGNSKIEGIPVRYVQNDLSKLQKKLHKKKAAFEPVGIRCPKIANHSENPLKTVFKSSLSNFRLMVVGAVENLEN